MENSAKLKLSSDLIITKLLSLFGVCLMLVLVFGTSKNPVDDDFKTGLENKIFLVAFIIMSAYLFTRPIIYYDSTNFYIKRINKNEISIPLKNIKCFFENPFFSRGTAHYTIEFINNSSEKKSIKFIASYSSENIKQFKTLIKKINSHVEII